jgi:flagellar biosynthesis protein FlhB
MASEKKLPPSSKKLRDAQEKGDVAKSKDFSAQILLISTLIFIYWCSNYLFNQLKLFDKFFDLGEGFVAENMIMYSRHAFAVIAALVVPFFCWIVLSAFLIEVSQVGFHFSPKSLRIDFSKINPAKGFKKLLRIEEGEENSSFFLPILFEVLKLVLYLVFGLVGLLATFYLKGRMVVFFNYQNGQQIFDMIFDSARLFFVIFLSLSLLVGFWDLFIVKRKRMKRLRMDIEEFKKEMRESEGSPEMKGSRKQRHHEILLSSLVQGVRKAKVLIKGKS